MNDHKFAFIMCCNNEMLMDESLAYLSKLSVPEGYEVEVFTITDAKSMTSGYNDAIKSSDAKYKIYMHQDVFILNPNFLERILDIFKSDSKIGMIGLIGYPILAENAIMWESDRVGAVPMYGIKGAYGKIDFENDPFDVAKDVIDVAAIDGLCMITQYDIPWDSDFNAWDFYDASHSVDVLLEGYRVVVPNQAIPWFIHDDGRILSLFHYNVSRKLFMQKHGKYLGKTWNEILQ